MRILVLIALGLLTACAPRGELRFAPEAASIGDVQRIFVGTSRADDGEEVYSSNRGYELRHARFDISIPPQRELGSMPWPRKNEASDPRKHMLTVQGNLFKDSKEFRSALSKELSQTPKAQREAVIFIHGFNNNFAEGLYRFAQIYHDMELPGVPVHYSWPSRGSVLGYAYDRDSSLFARDGLEALIREVALSGANKIHLVAHSMGGHLTMEALRNLYLRGDQNILNRLGGTMLISPDIDVDVFRAQGLAIGKLPQPFVVFTSQKDNALAVSATLARENNRLGNLTDVSRLGGLDVTLLDTSNVEAADTHLAPGTSPILLQLIRSGREIDGALMRDAQSRVGLLPGAVLTFQGATQVILKPVAQLAE